MWSNHEWWISGAWKEADGIFHGDVTVSPRETEKIKKNLNMYS